MQPDKVLTTNAKSKMQMEPMTQLIAVAGEEIKSATIVLSYLNSFSNGDEEFERDILLMSIDEIGEKMNEFRLAVQNADRTAVSQVAHSAKSLSTIIGSQPLHVYFLEIENTCYNCAETELHNKVEEADKLWILVKQSLHKLLQQKELKPV